MSTHTLEMLCLFLLMVVTLFAGLARRLGIPYPILLVLAGLAISFVPHVPRVPLNPDLVFAIFLPPLLYAAAWQTNWRDFRRNIVSISMLATGLVAFTVAGVAVFAQDVIPSFDLRSGFLLGAVVAATDAVAATSIARSLGLAPNITGLLEGESLLNDATGLLALEFGLALLNDGPDPTVSGGILRLLWLILGGVGTGLILGRLVTVIEHWVEDGPLEMAISLIVPYVAYLAAEELRSSGVLAVVACGLFLSRRSAEFFAPPARIEVMGAWRSLDFLLNGTVFTLIGLQLPYVLAGIRGFSRWKLIVLGLCFSFVLILLRMLWVFPGAHVSLWLRRHILHQNPETPSARSMFVVGWTGMRGVVSLAAAFSLPETLSNGRPFPQRNLILFLTFSTILVTLVLQGLSLPPLIRRLGLDGNRESQEEELTARRRVLLAAIGSLQHALDTAPTTETHDIDDLLHRYRHRLDAINAAAAESQRVDASGLSPDGSSAPQPSLDRHRRRSALIRQAVSVERHTLLSMRDDGSIGDDVLRRLERELDLTDARYETRE
ncbi:MAG TPA: Na+/H+ antiporter [Acidobacteriaceae bacterium]|nr:Na+/H+ antiporter [Acidobacteriaceae bacterium]